MEPPAEPLLELETRRRIYDHVTRTPGVHLRQIQRDLDIPLGTLEYHLHQLERKGLLVVRDDRRFKAYFPASGMDRRDRDLLYYLRQEMPRRIAMEVAQRPGVSFKDLSTRMPVSASTMSFHLKKLVKAGILSEERQGREKLYRAPEADRVKRLVVEYRKTFVDDVVDRFADAWMDLGL